MTRFAAKALMRIGVVMLLLCVACRFVIETPSGMMGDDLAIIASLALVVAAALYLRFGPREEADRAGGATSSHARDRTDRPSNRRRVP